MKMSYDDELNDYECLVLHGLASSSSDSDDSERDSSEEQESKFFQDNFDRYKPGPIDPKHYKIVSILKDQNKNKVLCPRKTLKKKRKTVEQVQEELGIHDLIARPDDNIKNTSSTLEKSDFHCDEKIVDSFELTNVQVQNDERNFQTKKRRQRRKFLKEARGFAVSTRVNYLSQTSAMIREERIKNKKKKTITNKSNKESLTLSSLKCEDSEVQDEEQVSKGQKYKKQYNNMNNMHDGLKQNKEVSLKAYILKELIHSVVYFRMGNVSCQFSNRPKVNEMDR